MYRSHAVCVLAATIAACGADHPTCSGSVDNPRDGQTAEQVSSHDSLRELHFDGELGEGDFTLPTGAYGDRHELHVEQGEVLEIILQSSDFDTYLQVVTPSGETQVNDDYPNAAHQSRLTVIVRRDGPLKITVTSYAPNSSGRYRLDVNRRRAPQDVLVAANENAEDFGIVGDFLPNAVRVARELLKNRLHHRVDLPPVPDPGSPSAPSPHQVPGASIPDASSHQFPDLPGIPSSNTVNVPGYPGSSTPGSTSSSRQPTLDNPGQHTSSPLPSGSHLSTTSLQIGAQVPGRLEQGDGALTTGEFRDLYSFQGQPGLAVAIEVQSSRFDTYLILVSPSGQQWENDDANGDRNSLIIMNLPEAGIYRIVVTSYRPGESGDYLLKIRSPGALAEQTASGVQSQVQAQPSQTFTGELHFGDSTSASGEFVDQHQVSLQAGQAVQVRLESQQFDTILFVRAPSGRQWDNDDFQQGSLNSGLDFVPPETGQYTMTVSSYRPGETGRYLLTVRSLTGASSSSVPTPGTTLPTPGVPRSEPGLSFPGPGAPPALSMPGGGQPIQGNLAQGDSALDSGEFMDMHQIQLVAGQRVSIRINSSEFDTYLIVRAPSGRQWDNDDIQPGNLNSGLDLTLTESGGYHFIVTSYRPGETGAYTLTVTPGSAPDIPVSAGVGPGQTAVPSISGPGAIDPTPVPPAGTRPQPGGGRIFGIYVGISAYPTSRLPLCADDASKLAEDMRRAGLQTQEQQILLTDADATPAGVRQAFARMASQIRPNDMFIFFYSGHGEQSPEQPGSRELDLREESINLIGGDITDDEMARLFDQIRARVSIIALDSCFSGGFARDVIARPGRMGYFSSEEDLTSNVASSFQAGGYLSHFLRLGLRGEADTNPRDSLLTAGELSHYLYTMFGTHMQDVRASTTESDEGHQHLVIDRGSVRVNTPLVSYR